MSGVKRIGGGPAVHFASYIEHPKYGRARVYSCGRHFVQKWTTDRDSVSCFSCLEKMGVLDTRKDRS